MYPFKMHVSDSGYLLNHSLHSYTTHYKGLVCVQNSQHMCIMCAIDTFIPAMQLTDWRVQAELPSLCVLMGVWI